MLIMGARRSVQVAPETCSSCIQRTVLEDVKSIWIIRNDIDVQTGR